MLYRAAGHHANHLVAAPVAVVVVEWLEVYLGQIQYTFNHRVVVAGVGRMTMTPSTIHLRGLFRSITISGSVISQRPEEGVNEER